MTSSLLIWGWGGSFLLRKFWQPLPLDRRQHSNTWSCPSTPRHHMGFLRKSDFLMQKPATLPHNNKPIVCVNTSTYLKKNSDLIKLSGSRSQENCLSHNFPAPDSTFSFEPLLCHCWGSMGKAVSDIFTDWVCTSQIKLELQIQTYDLP